MEKLTHKQIVLKMLETGRWVSTVDMVHKFILRGPARIHDLRMEGYEIEGRKVKGKSYEEYRLVTDGQPTLI